MISQTSKDEKRDKGDAKLPSSDNLVETKKRLV